MSLVSYDEFVRIIQAIAISQTDDWEETLQAWGIDDCAFTGVVNGFIDVYNIKRLERDIFLLGMTTGFHVGFRCALESENSRILQDNESLW